MCIYIYICIGRNLDVGNSAPAFAFILLIMAFSSVQSIVSRSLTSERIDVVCSCSGPSTLAAMSASQRCAQTDKTSLIFSSRGPAMIGEAASVFAADFKKSLSLSPKTSHVNHGCKRFARSNGTNKARGQQKRGNGFVPC